MNWYCIGDQQRLILDENRLTCTGCGQIYDLRRGIPIFTDKHEKPGVTDTIPLLEELWNYMRQDSIDNAERRFCQKHGYRIDAYGTSWYLLFPFPKQGPVLEIRAGIAHDTIGLTEITANTITLVPNVTTSFIVQRQLEERGKNKWQIAILDDISLLPFADSQLEAVVMDQSCASVFNLSNRNLPIVAKEWRRVLKPGGTVLIGMKNPYFPHKLIKFVRSKSYSKDSPLSVNQVQRSPQRIAR